MNGLEGFYWVAKAGGYAAAARAFPRAITQPAVYQQVRRLEEELGVDLVERGPGRSVRLTAAGDELYRFCAPFFQGWPETLRRVQAAANSRRLAIAASGLVLREFIPQWVHKLRRIDPQRVVEVEELHAPELDRLRSGALDLIVDFLPEIPPDIETRQVAEAVPFVVMPHDHPGATACPFDAAVLRDTPLVSYHPSLPQHPLQLEAARRYVGEPKQQLSASSVDVIVAFVAAGMGYSLVPWLNECGPQRPGIVSRAMLDYPERYPVVAAWSGTGPNAAAMRLLLEALAPSEGQAVQH